MSAHRALFAFEASMAVSGIQPFIKVLDSNGDPIVGAVLKVSQVRLRELFRYDDNLGRLVWVVTNSNRAPAGSIAGTLNRATGYRYVRVDGDHYLEHRLIWLFVYGEWPDQVDHIDLDKANNHIGNLRKANSSQNQANGPRQKNNTSGFKGVSRCRERWRAAITYNGRSIFLGVYDTPELAQAAYLAKSIELFGEFARAA